MFKQELIRLTNLTFEPDFFEDEVREGFYVSSMMKRYWACQLKVLSEIARICEKHEIKWFAEYGTLMGAVRHAGYIPWDDDLDIVMMREDWNKFFKVAHKELPAGYRALTIESAYGYEEVIGRVVNSGTIDFSSGHLKEFYGCPYTVGVDIFPADGVYNDPDKEKERNYRAKKVLAKLNSASGKEKHELLKQIEMIYSECPTDGCENVALMPFYIPSGHHLFPKKLYESYVELPFENTLMRVNARYEELLELEYGNYLSINKKGGLHEYPVYAEQERILRDKIGHNPYRYTLDIKELMGSVQRYAKRLTRQLQNTDSPEDKHKKTNLKKQVVFLPCKAKWWNTMESLWRAYSSNPEFEVHVLPVFYYDCSYNGEIGQKHDERELFPDYVHVGACEKYDFEGIHPDVIVLQVPYDGYSTTMTVHEFFYSSNMQKCTEELVYVPCMEMDSPEEDGDKASVAMSVFIENEAVINADKVVVSSEKLREYYINHLVKLTGEDTSVYWKQKIVNIEDEKGRINGENHAGATLVKSEQKTLGSLGILQDGVTRSSDESGMATDTDDAWSSFLGKYDGRKVLVYHMTIGFMLRNPEKAIEKIYRSIETFKSAGNKICAVIVPQKQIMTFLPEIDKELWEKFKELIAVIKASDNCIYDEQGEALAHMNKWNGYYGDADPLVRKCLQMGIPVMIESIDV